MAKHALLIGVSDYGANLPGLPAAVRDITAMQRLFAHADIGGFDRTIPLPNPDPQTMRE